MSNVSHGFSSKPQLISWTAVERDDPVGDPVVKTQSHSQQQVIAELFSDKLKQTHAIWTSLWQTVAAGAASRSLTLNLL